MSYNVENINFRETALELAYSSIHNLCAIKKIAVYAIEQLYFLYERSGNKEFLNDALNHIKVYMKFGLNPYDEEELFRSVIEALGLEWTSVYIKAMSCKKEKVAKTNILSMIHGSWKISDVNKMSKVQVIDDIYNKLMKQEKGSHIYKYIRGSQEIIHYLVITEEHSYLYNSVDRRIHVFSV